MEELKSLLKKITKKKYIYLVKRGNDALKQIIKNLPKKVYLIQDQGGWITYKQYPKHYEELKTNEGVLEDMTLLKKESILLINSLPGYFAVQPMEELTKICKEKNMFIINDISGSIGTPASLKGDIVFGSCGKNKPVNVGYGGFIGSDIPLNIEENFDPSYLRTLKKAVQELPKRLQALKARSQEIKQDLKKYHILHRNDDGMNVIVAYDTTQEEDEIIKYCQNHSLEYTKCPRYIRVNKQALSIEVKRT